jgi:hypothetical protein
MAMLDAEGQYSMPKLARKLGVTTMALYRHVLDRGDLNASIVDLAFRTMEVHDPPSEDWRSGVEYWMRDVREHWIRHPWLGSIFAPAAQLSPGGFAVMGRLVRVLTQAGLEPAGRARAVVWISRVTVGLALLENQTSFNVGPDPDSLIALVSAGTRDEWNSILPDVVSFTPDRLFDEAIATAISLLEGQQAVRSTRVD